MKGVVAAKQLAREELVASQDFGHECTLAFVADSEMRTSFEDFLVHIERDLVFEVPFIKLDEQVVDGRSRLDPEVVDDLVRQEMHVNVCPLLDVKQTELLELVFEEKQVIFECPIEPDFQDVLHVVRHQRGVQLHVVVSQFESAPELNYKVDFVIEKVVVIGLPIEVFYDFSLERNHVEIPVLAKLHHVLLIMRHSTLHTFVIQEQVFSQVVQDFQVVLEYWVGIYDVSSLQLP